MSARFDGTIIIGSGIAALSTALALAPEPVLILTATRFGFDASSQWAQGGMAASVGPDDNAELHAADTVAAGAGLTDLQVARSVTSAAGDVVAFLESYGLAFDRDLTGGYVFGLEAAHSRRRILHAGGDATGARIMHALSAAARNTPSISVWENCPVISIETDSNRATGVVFLQEGQPVRISARAVVLATGGIGGLFDATTNPAGNFGHGIALAARAGAELADMEFVQFHPTALAVKTHPLPLVSEAVRGEGAYLINDRGEQFMADYPGRELAPRDVVARAIAAEIGKGRKVYLDARQALGARFATRFPAIDVVCRAHGMDAGSEPIPVRPAAHYHMGGVATDIRGCTSLDGLYAVGEVAATGLHGGNRLASNSLLEAVVMGRLAAQTIRERSHDLPRTKLRDLPLKGQTPEIAPSRSITSRHLGLSRDGNGLRLAIEQLLPLALGTSAARDPALVALLVAVFAALREESSGSHARLDFPASATNSTRRFINLGEALDHARAFAEPGFSAPRSAHA